MVVIHPRMSAVQVETLIERHNLRLKLLNRGTRLFLTVVAPGADSSLFLCDGCGWQGENPAILDFDSLALPSIADIPICPRCEGFVYRTPARSNHV
jgi:hypothetical protein